MQHQLLQVTLRSDVGNKEIVELKPVDVVIRNNAEYLIGTRPDDGEIEIRLDLILQFITKKQP